jgi:hypothetical protein
MEGLRWLKCAEPYADMCHFEAVRPLEAPCSVAELSPLAEPLEEPLEEEAWLWSAVCRCCRIERRPSKWTFQIFQDSELEAEEVGDVKMHLARRSLTCSILWFHMILRSFQICSAPRTLCVCQLSLFHSGSKHLTQFLRETRIVLEYKGEENAWKPNFSQLGDVAAKRMGGQSRRWRLQNSRMQMVSMIVSVCQCVSLSFYVFIMYIIYT